MCRRGTTAAIREAPGSQSLADTRCTTATATVGATLQVQSVLLSPDNLEPWVKKIDLKAPVARPRETQVTMVARRPFPPLSGGRSPPTTALTLPGALAFQVYEQGLF
jgi:hypothetical protein